MKCEKMCVKLDEGEYLVDANCKYAWDYVVTFKGKKLKNLVGIILNRDKGE